MVKDTKIRYRKMRRNVTTEMKKERIGWLYSIHTIQPQEKCRRAPVLDSECSAVLVPPAPAAWLAAH